MEMPSSRGTSRMSDHSRVSSPFAVSSLLMHSTPAPGRRQHHLHVSLDEGGLDVDYEALDRARDKMDMGDDLGVGSMGAYGQGWGQQRRQVAGGAGGQHGNDVEEMEQRVEKERQRLRGIEQELDAARSNRKATAQLSVVQKSGKVLEGVMGQLSQLTREELDERYAIEDEWRHRIEAFERQHREMEEALRRRHTAQLKRMHKEIEREVSLISKEAERSWERAPSPRTVGRIQAENMERLARLFHTHAEERAHLVGKVSKQEELLVESKNQAVNRLMEGSQARSVQVYQRHGVQHAVRDARLSMSRGGLSTGGGRSGREDSPMSFRLGAGTPLLPQTPATRRSMSAHGQSILPETSPRIDTAASTFLTEMFLPDDDATGHEPTAYGTDFRSVTVENGIMRLVSAGVEELEGMREGSRGHTATSNLSWSLDQLGTGGVGRGDVGGGDVGGGGSKRDTTGIRRSKLNYGDQVSTAVQYPTEPRLPDYGPVFQPSTVAPMPGTAASGWRPFREVGESTRPAWNGSKSSKASYMTQVTTPVYEVPASQRYGEQGGGGGKKMKSPYLINLVNGRGGGGQPQGRTRRVSTMVPEVRGGGAGGEQQQSPDRQRLTFPKLGNTAASPKAAKGLFGEREARFTKLEGWVEDKIRSALMEKKEEQGEEGGVQERAPPQGRRGSLHMVGANRRRSSVGGAFAEGAEEVKEEEIGGLINRLRQTIASDAEKREPSRIPLRRGSDRGTEGVEVVGSKELKAQQDKAMSNKGRAVAQDADVDAAVEEGKQLYDETSRVFLATRETPVSAGATDRRSLLAALESTSSKRVEFAMSGEDGDGASAEGYGTRIGTSASGVMRGTSRPTTGFSTLASTAPGTASGQEGADIMRINTAATGATDAEEGNDDDYNSDAEMVDKVPEGKLVYSDKEFFVWVTRNKLKEVQLALLQGRDIDKRDDFGNTALMRAAQNGHFRMAKLCFKFDAEPNVQNHQGNTALHFAMGYKYKKVIDLLKDYGADESVMNNKGVPASTGLGE